VTNGRPANVAASVRQQLLGLSRERGENFQLVLTWYVAERFLYRLAQSKHSEQFILKGAMLLNVWMDRSHRPTRVLDFAGYGDASPERLMTLFREICQVEVEEDGLQYDTENIQVNEIRENQQYQGQRVRLIAYLEAARIPVQIDIGFGDVVSPEAEEISYPTLLDLPAPRILAYPPETVISEKLQAMVALGMLNSRMKDFYDLRMISRLFTFDGAKLVEAIRATFDRRRTEITESAPVALTEEFSKDPDKTTQWKAFLLRSGLEDTAVDLPQIIEELMLFLVPPLQAAASGRDFNLEWTRGGPWATVGGQD
jgi:predicted nucleotidyltransferase component of viral defense system